MKLKKLLLIACALFCMVLKSNAQGDSPKSWRFGLQAAPSLNWFKTDTKGIEGDGAKLGFSWGFMAEYYFADNYAIATGMNLGGYGGKLSATNPLALVNYDLTLNYIDIPITVKMRTNEIGYMRYFGQFGITPGINISSKADLVQTYTTNFAGVNTTVTTTTDDVDFQKEIIPLNVGLLIALGAEYSLSGNTSLVLSVSFHNGFLDIADFSVPDPTATNFNNSKDVKVNANAVRLNVGILF